MRRLATRTVTTLFNSNRKTFVPISSSTTSSLSITATTFVQKRRFSFGFEGSSSVKYTEDEEQEQLQQITRHSLPEIVPFIQQDICQANFVAARSRLESIEEFLENEWICVESREEECEYIYWKMYTARQLAGVYHEMRDEESAMRKCNQVLALEKDCKRLGMLEEAFCELNFVCAVKAEIFAGQGDLENALKYQNFLIEGRLKKRLSKPILDSNFRVMLRKTLSLELTTRGNIYFAMGRFEEALADFTESLQMNSIDANTLLMKAKVYMVRSEYSLALQDARRCYSISSSSFMKQQASVLIDQCLLAQQQQGMYNNSNSDM